jgi:lysophospholipase L1-like esterase
VKAFLAKLLLLSLPSLCLTLTLVEVAFSLVVSVSDRPRFFYDDSAQVMKLAPHQTGTFTLGPWGRYLQGDFRINNAGWNSAHDYQAQKPADTLRIALIGDSFVEALQVDYADETVSAQVEARLNSPQRPTEVYSFGVSGSPLSNYLQLMRYVAAQYPPDIYVVVIVENDFAASFAGSLRIPHFLQVQRDPLTQQIVEIAPTNPNLRPWRTIARRSALVRYTYYNLNIVNLEALQLRLGLKTTQQTSLNFADSSLQAPSEAYLADMSAMLEYVLGQMQTVAQERPVLLVMDAPRRAYYDGLSVAEIEGHPSYQNQLRLRQSAQALTLPLLELYPIFQADFATNGEYLDFYPHDAHWNGRGHRLVAQAIADFLQESGWLNSLD